MANKCKKSEKSEKNGKNEKTQETLKCTDSMGLSNMAEYLFHEGTNYCAYEFFGAHFDGEEKCVFRVWAKNSKKVFIHLQKIWMD